MAAPMMLVAVFVAWRSALNRSAGGEFIPTAAPARAEDGARPPIESTRGAVLMGRQLSPLDAATASTFAASHIRAIGRAVISLKPSQDSTRFTSDPRAKHAVAEGIARLAEVPLHAITTSFTPTTSSNVGTLAGQERGFHTPGSVTADFTATFQAEPLAQEGDQPVVPLVHFPKAALFARKTKNNNTADLFGTFMLAAIRSELPGVQPYVFEVLELSILLFEEISVKESRAITSAEPAPSRSGDDAWPTWLKMAVVAAGATTTSVFVLVCFGIIVWRCCLWRRFSGKLNASVQCVAAADTPNADSSLAPQWLHNPAAEGKLPGVASPLAHQHVIAHAAEKGQAVAAVADKRQPRFMRRQQVLVYSGSQGGWVEGSVHSLLPDGSVLVRYGKGKNCFEKKVPHNRIDTSIRRPYLRKQKVLVFCEELNAWVPGNIEVAHTDDSLVVLFEKGGMPCRAFVPKMLVQSRIRRVC